MTGLIEAVVQLDPEMNMIPYTEHRRPREIKLGGHLCTVCKKVRTYRMYRIRNSDPIMSYCCLECEKKLKQKETNDVNKNW